MTRKKRKQTRRKKRSQKAMAIVRDGDGIGKDAARTAKDPDRAFDEAIGMDSGLRPGHAAVKGPGREPVVVPVEDQDLVETKGRAARRKRARTKGVEPKRVAASDVAKPVRVVDAAIGRAAMPIGPDANDRNARWNVGRAASDAAAMTNGGDAEKADAETWGAEAWGAEKADAVTIVVRRHAAADRITPPGVVFPECPGDPEWMAAQECIATVGRAQVGDAMRCVDPGWAARVEANSVGKGQAVADRHSANSVPSAKSSRRCGRRSKD